MDGQNLILITRPVEDADGYAAELESEGFQTFTEPMLQVLARDFEVPDLSGYEGLIFTSANAVRIFAAASSERNIETYCVGHNTYEEAKKHGYNYLHNAKGGGEELVDILLKGARNVITEEGGAMITEKNNTLTEKNNTIKVQSNVGPDKDSAGPDNGSGDDGNKILFLHVRGQHVARPIDEMLKNGGVNADTLVVYRAEKVKALSKICIDKIQNGEIDAVTFFSRRTAENFLVLAKENQLTGALSHIKALCISSGVLECVRIISWAGTYTASQPDRQGMLSLIKDVCALAPERCEEIEIMSKTSQNAISNAEDVIEKFGGIRPMATKMSVPVTTVQGWKKRNVIPGTRLDALLQAAKDHNVNLDGVLERADAANENEAAKQARVVPEARAEESTKAAEVKGSKGGGGKPPFPLQNNIEKEFAASEKKAVTRSTLINALLVVLAIGALAALLWPKVEKVGQIETEVEAVKEEQSFLRNMIPEGFEQRMESLQEQAKEAQESVSLAVDAAKTISDDVLAEDAGSLQERVIRLETHVADLAGGSPQMVAMLQRAQAWRQSIPGQQQLGQSLSELNALVGGLDGNLENFDGALQQAREQSPALGQTFEGVPQQELKAAAMLLGLSKLRGSLNRDNESFEDDLQLLMNLVGEDNLELKSSLERLAPHAQDGVLTPEGLSAEFRGLAGDVVVSSLKGEDISVQEKAKARFNDLLQVEKDGELVTGTDTQATVVRAQNLLEAGNIEDAISQIQTLEGPAAEVVAPFLNKAQASLLAKNAKQMATQTINLRAFGDKALAAGKDILPGSGRLIQNEETGINILKPR
ncbi:MAG: uroporphyrinogen III methyltransferase [Micavibrio sp.]|nr:MAG: uroporphyrinogen III methyltransferase [Micavibrio sp.]